MQSLNSINTIEEDTQVNIAITRERIEASRLILAKLDNYDSIKNNKGDFSKEEIGFCTLCNKMIALKYTSCNTCNKNFCKKHREAHKYMCEINPTNMLKGKLLKGKNLFMDKLKQAKVNLGKT